VCSWTWLSVELDLAQCVVGPDAVCSWTWLSEESDLASEESDLAQ